MNYFMGIDPGASGAAVIINDSLEISAYWDCPADEQALAESFRTPSLSNFRPTLCVIEQVHAMPGQGVSSTFKFGRNFGVWLGCLAMCRLSYRLVTPQAWQKGLINKNDGPDAKTRSLAVARRTWPQETIFKRQKDNGRADAALMAIHARKIFYGA